MTVIEEIAAERTRQIEAEGWTLEHDDQHTDESLAVAAALYATPKPLFTVDFPAGGVTWDDPWPWHNEQEFRGGIVSTPAWDKREQHPRRRQLVIAAALIVAEIERQDRAVRTGGQR